MLLTPRGCHLTAWEMTAWKGSSEEHMYFLDIRFQHLIESVDSDVFFMRSPAAQLCRCVWHVASR